MGLSNEERMSRMVDDADHIFKLACDIEMQLKRHHTELGVVDQIANICQEAKGIWHALYGQCSNSAFWILGGSVGNELKNDSFDPLSMAMIHCMEQSKPSSESDDIVEKYENEHYYEQQMTHLYLTQNASPVLGSVLELYAYIEAVIYALRRYDDDFKRTYADFSALISSLQGQCYHVFRYSPIITHCYLIADIGKLILRNKEFEAALGKMNLQHDMRYMEERSLESLIELHKELHESVVTDSKGCSAPSLNTCVQVFLKLAGRRYHYDHNFQSLKRLLSENKKNKVDWAAAEALFAECKKLHVQSENHNRDRYGDKFLWEHMSAVHGYGYEIPVKDIKPVNKAIHAKTKGCKRGKVKHKSVDA